MNAIVIGVGSAMRGDDGFGAAVLDALTDLRGQVRLVRCDGEPARLIELWDGFEHVIVVDAARGGTEPFGHIHRRELAAGDLPGASEPSGNGHAAGFGSAMRLAAALDRLPPHLTLYAVHGTDFTLGAGLSRPVADAVAPLAERIRRELRSAPCV